MPCWDKPAKFYADPQPMQHVRWDGKGVIRVRENAIVRWMLDRGQAAGVFDLNDIARTPFPPEDREQFAQLIGYSVSGAGDLSEMSYATMNVADALAAELYEATGGIDPDEEVLPQRDHEQATDRSEAES